MQAFSIYETKTRLSELLRHVKRGRELVVTDRGRAVAKLVPYEEPKSLRERLNQLKAMGRLRPGLAGKITPVTRASGALKRFLKERE